MRSLAFLDLDLTLFDYTLARKEATLAALRRLGTERDPAELYDLVEKTLIPYGHLLTHWGMPDFRRAWRSSRLFAFLMVLSESGTFRRDCAHIREYLAGIERPHDPADEFPGSFAARYRHYQRLLATSRHTVLNSRLQETQSRLRDQCFKQRVSAAIAAFDRRFRENTHLRDGVDDLFASLREQGFEIYIVSEGDEDIQGGKVNVLGLGQSVDWVFVSSACGRSERLLDWLWGVAQACHPVRASATAELSAVRVLYDEVLQYALKSPTLFRKVAHSALVPSRRRSSFYRRFGWLDIADCGQQGPVRILMLGDRYDKDLYPAMQAFDEVISILLRAGKYRDTHPAHKLQASKAPSPTATVASLFEAAAFIRSHAGVGRSVSSSVRVPREREKRIQRAQRSLKVLQCSMIVEPNSSLDLLKGLPLAMLGSQ